MLKENVENVIVSGHTIFSKNSMFSGGLNLAEVSKMNSNMAEIVGYTMDEIKENFS